MAKRIASLTLWFLAAWLNYGLIASLMGLPDSIGAVIGLLAATIVWLEPTKHPWVLGDGMRTPSFKQARD